MECADVPDVSNEERNDDLSSIVPSETPWQCKPEFSTDKMVGNNKNLTARCRWSRTVSVPAECQINDGCVGSLCGSRAACWNKATITVVVLRTTPVSVTAVSSRSQGIRQRDPPCLRERAGLSWWKAYVPVSCVDKINGYSCS